MNGRVVIVGGGIAGLSTAYRLLGGAQPSSAPEVTVLESDGELGGKLRSVEVGGLQLEAGPDSLLARKPWGVDLCRELGLGEELVPPATGNTHIWTDVGLLRFPSGPFGISTDPNELWHWPGMSRRGKLRAIGDLWRRARRDETDESLGSLLRRRVGDEACDRLVAPLLGGLFAGDIDLLSVKATFPELAAWERSNGSLIRGARAAAKAAEGKTPPPMFLRLKGGFRRLTEELIRAVGSGRIRSETVVTSIRREGEAYVVRAGKEEFAADSVVLASPSFVTADLLEELVPEVATSLRRIPYLSTAVVLLVYPAGTGDALPDSSGFVVPRGKAAMTAATLVSRKWPDEAFGDRAVVRCFVGGAGAEDLLEEDDADIVEGVCRQLAAVLPLPPRAEASRVVRWPRAMPQYEVGHLDGVGEIERSLPPGVFVVGQAYRGAGIPDCVRAGGEVAERVRSHLVGDVERETVR
jgi:protoporphyrinogen/coproporphyrinogen III oxidase